MFKSFSFMGILFTIMFAIMFFIAVPVIAEDGGIQTDAVGVISQIDVINYSNTAPGAISVNTVKSDNLYNETFAQDIPALNCRDVKSKGSSVRVNEIKDKNGIPWLAVFWQESAEINLIKI